MGDPDRLRSFLSICLIALVLSPCVSSADDLTRLSSLAALVSDPVSAVNSDSRASSTPLSLSFERSLEELDHVQMTGTSVLFWLGFQGVLYGSIPHIASRTAAQSVFD